MITHTRYEVIPSTRIDTTEWMIEVTRDSKKYVGFVEVTGQRVAIDLKQKKDYMLKGLKKFNELIREGKIKTTERLRFGFWAKGDFIVK